MKKTKRTLSYLLSAVLAFTAVGMSAAAEYDEYEENGDAAAVLASQSGEAEEAAVQVQDGEPGEEITAVQAQDGEPGEETAAGQAQDGELDEEVLTNDADSDFTVVNGTLTKYNGTGGSVEIPSGVTAIGKEAFFNCSGLTAVTIPGSVVSIGESAFRGCSVLSSLTLPDSVTSVGYGAFRECIGLTSVNLGKNVGSIGSYAFYNCTGLKELDLPADLALIGDYAFYSCSGLKSIVIPSKVGKIGNYAFQNCRGIETAVISSGVSSVGSYAFSYCSGLKTLTVGDNVSTIGANAFLACEGLKTVTIGSGTTSIGASAFKSCIGLEDFDIKSGITSIGSEAFSGCTGLMEIVLPDSVTVLGEKAFYGCTGLVTVKLSANLTSINNNTFYGCVGIAGISIPANVTSVGEGAFRECKGLKSITIPDSVTSIGYAVFRDCAGLAELKLGSSVKLIGNYAFYNCAGIKELSIPESVTSIGNYAFYSCTGIKELTLPSKLTSLGDRAFQNCKGLKTLSVPGGLSATGYYSFAECSGLTKVVLSDGVKSIGSGTFSGCTALSDVTLGDNITVINANAFTDCTRLESIVLPESVTSLGTYVFYGCTALEGITIPESVTAIGSEAFKGCTGLEYAVLPESITKIAKSTFEGCSMLSDVNIPESVTVIEERAFYGCRSLERTDIPDSVTAIGARAFMGCTALGSVTVPGSVTSIGSEAFRDCRSMESAVIYDSVSDIGSYAFYGCSALEKIYYTGSETKWGRISKGNSAIPSGCEIIFDYVPTEVIKTDIADTTVSGINAQTYTGSAIAPAFTVSDGTRTLVSGVDYSSSYSNNINGGTAAVTLTGKGDYKGTKTVYFNILPKSLSDAVISDIPAQTYTGSAITPALSVYDGTRLLTQDKDYTVTYSGNTNVGTASAVITGKGNYSGTKTAAFSVIRSSEHPTLTATGGDAQIKLAWNAVSGASRYGVYRYSDGSYTRLDLNVTDTEYTVTGLKDDTEYTFFVQAYVNGGWTEPQEDSYATAKTDSYTPYTTLTAVGGDRSVKLSWTPVKRAVKYGIYRLKDGAYTKVDLDVTGTEYTVTGLEDDTEYTFLVQAYSTKWLPASDESYATARTDANLPYTTLTAVGGDRSVTLTWTPVSKAVKYGVYRYDNGVYTKLDLNVTDTTYTVKGLEEDTEYTFFVQAYSTQWLPAADVSYATAVTNEGLTYPVVAAAGGDGCVTLTWTPVSKAEKYGVYRYENGAYKRIDLNVTGTSYTVTGLDDDTEYTFFVQAYKAGKWLGGAPESYATASTDMAETYVTLTAVGGNKEIELSWTPVKRAVKYAVYRVENGVYTKEDLNVTGTSYTVTGLEDDTEYSFFVQAYSTKWLAGSEKSYATAKTNEGITYPIVTAVGGEKTVALTWTPVKNAQKYGVYSYRDGKFTKLDINVTECEYTVTGLEEDTEYTFFVQAYKNKWLAGSQESYATARTSAGLTYPIVTAEGGDKSVTLTWTPVSKATKYGVYRYENGVYTRLDNNVTECEYVVSGLDESREYTFFVQAYRDKWLAGSQESYATARTNDPLTYPIVAANGGDKQMTLTWTSVKGASKYGVYRYDDGKYTKLDLNVTGNYYRITDLEEDTEYTFFVQAYKNGKWLAGGEESYVTEKTREGITYTEVTAVGGDKSAVLSWIPVKNAQKYGIYFFKDGKYTKADLDVTDCEYTVTGLEEDTEYTFFVQAYKDGRWREGTEKSYVTVKTEEGIPYPILSAKGGDKSVTLTWTEVYKASKYGVYAYNDGKYTKIDLAVTDTEYTVTGLDDDTEYSFFVQAYRGKWLPGSEESYATAKTGEGITYPIVTAVGGDKSVTLTWTPVKNAQKYGVYEYKDGKYTKIDLEVTDCEYTVTDLEDETEYTFFVQAYKDKWRAGSEESYAAAVTNEGATYPTVTAVGGERLIKLTWTPVNKAAKYGVYRYEDGEYIRLDNNVTGCEYTVSGLEEGTEYTFFVQAYKDGTWRAGSEESYATAKTNEGITYPIVTAAGGDRQITLTWQAVNGAEKYGVYMVNDGVYTRMDLNVTGTSYTVTGLEEDTEYTFFVQAYKGKWLSGGEGSTVTARTSEGISYPIVSAIGGDKSVTLTWTPVNKAVRYGVYRYENGEYIKLDLNVTDTVYTVTGLEDDTEYTFFVQAYTTKWLPGSQESYASAMTGNGLTYPIAAARGGVRQITVVWTPVSNAVKYGLYRVENGKNIKIDLAITDTTYTVTGLEPDTEYTFFVQAYTTKWLDGSEESYVTTRTK